MSDVAETNRPERKSFAGRKSLFRAEYVPQVEKMCKLGATEHEIATFLGASVQSLWRWRVAHPEFAEAFKLGREAATNRVEHSLFHRAVGYTFDSEKILNVDKQVVRVPIKEHVPPDVQAQQYWLNNRRSSEWQSRTQVEMGGPGDFDRMSDDELRRFIDAEAAIDVTPAAPKLEEVRTGIAPDPRKAKTGDLFG